MTYLIYLALSAICTNGVHGWLLLTQKNIRKWSISEHATLSKRTHLLYILGHVSGGIFFVLFAQSYFVEVIHNMGLFYLSVFIVFFEYVQALLPARGKTNSFHILAAYVMWVSFVVLGCICLVVLDASGLRKAAALPIDILVLFIFGYAHFDKQKLYKYQMTMVLLFYAALFVLVS